MANRAIITSDRQLQIKIRKPISFFLAKLCQKFFLAMRYRAARGALINSLESLWGRLRGIATPPPYEGALLPQHQSLLKGPYGKGEEDEGQNDRRYQ
jgi:hypothetical protein